MKRVYFAICGVSMLLLFVGCNSSEAEEEFVVGPSGGNQQRTEQDVIDDFNNLDIQPGVNDFTLESTDPNFPWNFRVITPANSSPTNKRPLVMHLHGGSGNSSPDAHKSTDCYVRPGVIDLDAFIISPNAGPLEWYHSENQDQVLSLIDMAKNNWDVDTDKILVTGFSNGGNASWFFADYHPSYFTASIAMASSYNGQRPDGSLPAVQVPLYVIHSDGDEIFPIELTEILVDRSKTAGSTIEYKALEGLSHFTPCDEGYVNALKDGVDWVVNNVWN